MAIRPAEPLLRGLPYIPLRLPRFLSEASGSRAADIR